jgi:hypothetical protein
VGTRAEKSARVLFLCNLFSWHGRLACASPRVRSASACRILPYTDANSLDLWVVHVREIDPLAGIEPLEWVLLTNVPTETLAAAIRSIEWYRCRPMIEEFHKGMKTGCNVESMQFEHADRLEPAIGLLSVVAAVLLQLRHVARKKMPPAHRPRQSCRSCSCRCSAAGATSR